MAETSWKQKWFCRKILPFGGLCHYVLVKKDSDHTFVIWNLKYEDSTQDSNVGYH